MQELRGMPVVESLAKNFTEQIEKLKKNGIVPKLSVVRVGSSEDDLSYERGIHKRFSAVNALVDVVELPEGVPQETLESAILALNRDNAIHGILLFRPLPKHLSEKNIKMLIDPEKDVDCMGEINMARVFSGDPIGYPPCTAQAVMELLDFYGIELTGKKVTVVGRSLVVGKPVAMLLLGRHATVTICHTRTKNLAEECRRADVLIACAGSAGMITPKFTHSEQIILDVGIHMVGGKLCGDVDYTAVAGHVKAITPVPGGVGTVTTSVLLKHTILSAQRV